MIDKLVNFLITNIPAGETEPPLYGALNTSVVLAAMGTQAGVPEIKLYDTAFTPATTDRVWCVVGELPKRDAQMVQRFLGGNGHSKEIWKRWLRIALSAKGETAPEAKGRSEALRQAAAIVMQRQRQSIMAGFNSIQRLPLNQNPQGPYDEIQTWQTADFQSAPLVEGRDPQWTSTSFLIIEVKVLEVH